MVEPRRRFRFLKELSEGAFGKVYMAEMITGEGFSSIVAIKLLHGKWAGHLEIAQRSRDEARLLGLLHHRNIVRVEDLSSINGQCAIVMEYLDGVDLKALTAYCQKNGVRFPKRAAFEITAQIAGALEAAYNQMPLKGGRPLHVIHRDIKPSNVMVTSAGDVKVLDFGTARANFEEREAKTQALAFGSQAYMAPERLLGDPDGPAGDVFSLGVTLFELLTFQSYGKIFIRQERYDRALDERMEMLDLSDINPEGAELVRDVLRRLLAYDGAVRPSSGEVVDLMDNLADVVNDGSMQRFCRQVVKPCRDAMESPQNPDDPLTGSTLFEDTATGLSLIPNEGAAEAAAAAQSPSADPTEPPAPTELAAAEPDPVGPPAPAQATPGAWSPPTSPRTFEPVAAPASPSWSPPSASRTVEPVAQASRTPSITPDAPPAPEDPSAAAPQPTWPSVEPQPSLPPPPPERYVQTVQPSAPRPPPTPAPAPAPSGGMGKIIGISAIIGVLVVVGVSALLFRGGDDPAPADPTPPAEAQAAPTPEVKAPPGGRVEVGPMDGSNGALKLTLGKPALVNLTSVTGFKHDWDGTGTLELVGIPPGSYRTKVGTGSDTVRAAIDVTAGKTCTYALDNPAAKEWEAKGCE